MSSIDVAIFVDNDLSDTTPKKKELPLDGNVVSDNFFIFPSHTAMIGSREIALLKPGWKKKSCIERIAPTDYRGHIIYLNERVHHPKQIMLGSGATRPTARQCLVSVSGLDLETLNVYPTEQSFPARSNRPAQPDTGNALSKITA